MSKKLFIPGPIDVSEDVLEKMATPVISHRSPNEPQENTAALFAVQHLMEPSIKPVPEDVDNYISLWVKNYLYQDL